MPPTSSFFKILLTTVIYLEQACPGPKTSKQKKQDSDCNCLICLYSSEKDQHSHYIVSHHSQPGCIFPCYGAPLPWVCE